MATKATRPRSLKTPIPRHNGEAASKQRLKTLNSIIADLDERCEAIFTNCKNRASHEGRPGLTAVAAASLATEYGVRRQLLDEALDAGELVEVAVQGILLGRCAERARLLPDADRGKRFASGLPKGPDAQRAKFSKRKAWVRREYASVLTANPKNKARARRLVRDAYQDKYPGETIALDTIKKWASTPRSNGKK